MTERLIIDLPACDACDHCALGPAMLALRERATFELVCRRCAIASCVLACPFDALERLDDGGVIKRHNLRCVSCKSCALACPFGTIYTELLPFYSMDYDAAVAWLAAGPRRAERLATITRHCPQHALEFREVDDDDPDVHVINDFLAARTRRWRREEGRGGAG